MDALDGMDLAVWSSLYATGVMLGDFYSQGVAQLNLFEGYGPQRNSEALMRVVDGLNQSCKARFFVGQG